MIWNLWNGGAEQLARYVPPGRYYRLRYEQFIEQPEAVLGDIIARSGLDARPDDVVANRHVTMRQDHTIGGNPVRFKQSMALRLDQEWVEAMPRGQRALTTALTWPLLRRYGYRLDGRIDGRA
jgi:hypothetical protein